jgi:hypothetical protein
MRIAWRSSVGLGSVRLAVARRGGVRLGIGRGPISRETALDFTISITGTRPLLMHNGRLADPLDPAAKALKAFTGKRGKTDADYAEVGRVEFAGAIYIDPDLGPYLPADNIWKTLHVAAKKTKHGKLIEEGVIITTEVNPLVYPGPRDIDGLWRSGTFEFRKTVVNQRNRVPRTRPIFNQWSVTAEGVFDENVIDLPVLAAIASRAGALVGLGDWRPKFGRFTAEVAGS